MPGAKDDGPWGLHNIGATTSAATACCSPVARPSRWCCGFCSRCLFYWDPFVPVPHKIPIITELTSHVLRMCTEYIPIYVLKFAKNHQGYFKFHRIPSLIITCIPSITAPITGQIVSDVAPCWCAPQANRPRRILPKQTTHKFPMTSH